EVFEFAKDDLERRDLARVGLADDHRGVADGQGVAHVVDEFDRARGIEESEPVAEIVDAGDIGLDAHRMAARLRTRIADGRAFAHRPLPRDAPAARQYPLEKAGFAALKRPDDGDETGTGDAVLVIGSAQYRPPSSVTPRERGAARVSFARRSTPYDPSAPPWTRLSQSSPRPGPGAGPLVDRRGPRAVQFDMLARTGAPRKAFAAPSQSRGGGSHSRPASCMGRRNRDGAKMSFWDEDGGSWVRANRSTPGGRRPPSAGARSFSLA